MTEKEIKAQLVLNTFDIEKYAKEFYHIINTKGYEKALTILENYNVKTLLELHKITEASIIFIEPMFHFNNVSHYFFIKSTLETLISYISQTLYYHHNIKHKYKIYLTCKKAAYII